MYPYAASVTRCYRAEAFGKHRGKGPGFRRCQPQPEQMSFALRLRPIFKGRSVVQQSMIVNELHVAGQKLHRKEQSRIIRQGVEQVEGLLLFWGEGRSHESAR